MSIKDLRAIIFGIARKFYKDDRNIRRLLPLKLKLVSMIRDQSDKKITKAATQTIAEIADHVETNRPAINVTTEKEQQQKPKEATPFYMEEVNSDLYDKARKELEQLEKESLEVKEKERRKQKIITELADKLENERGMKKRTIPALIATELKGFVPREHVFKSLGETQRISEGDYDGIWQIDAENYNVDELNDYDSMLLRDIVRYQHKLLKEALNRKEKEKERSKEYTVKYEMVTETKFCPKTVIIGKTSLFGSDEYTTWLPLIINVNPSKRKAAAEFDIETYNRGYKQKKE
jgi:hypothetical protein